MEPEIIPAQLLRQLDHVARHMQQSCSYQSQESYLRFKQGINEATRAYKAEQGCEYQESPVHVDEELAGPILAIVAELQQ